jgi:hypothetical protein
VSSSGKPTPHLPPPPVAPPPHAKHTGDNPY